MGYFEQVNKHYNDIWENTPKVHLWEKGPVNKLNDDFRVLEYPPTSKRQLWTYASCGMSSHIVSEDLVEIHMFSHEKDDSLVELLTALAYYHKNSKAIDLNDTVNFGRPWQSRSLCTHGFISLPYLDGPELEILHLRERSMDVKCYWLIPITGSELAFKNKFGTEALEIKFEQKGLDYLNPNRKSVC